MLTRRIEDSFAKYQVFTIRDVRLAMPDASIGNIRQTLSYMVSKKRLYRVRSGKYAFKRDALVSGFAYRPFYYGLLSALTYRGLWDQLARPCIITTNNVKRSSAKVFVDMLVEVHHIPGRYMFGFANVQYGGFTVPVSDPEKTLIDMAYLKVKGSDECYAALAEVSDIKKLNDYLKAYDARTRGVVLKVYHRYSAVARY
ncbi:MAG: type IV toxin-antitoxin system AbiEi family antitoxin domain-containing protein [Candidatus Micrarchaeota archaeon]|nr:type IV toxin-antitoxin system AbiEi family antitoxin domain-containing protein [Candidatus Micrarchaeota archaeon]